MPEFATLIIRVYNLINTSNHSIREVMPEYKLRISDIRPLKLSTLDKPDPTGCAGCEGRSPHHSGACKRKKHGYPRDTGSQGDPQVREDRKAWAKIYNFLTIDGEAVDGRYIMLACSDGSIVENPEGLTTYQCLKFLTTQELKTFWGFSFDYDVNQILAGLGISHLTMLTRHTRVRFGEYQITHIPGKMFRVTDREIKRTATVWDIFSFVRVGFAKWLEEWEIASGKDLEFIEAMKDKRPIFSMEDIDEIRRYCFTELEYLDLGVREFLDRIRAAEIRPRSWHSPGSVAAAVLHRENIKDHILDPDGGGKRLRSAARAAYFGGRFEARMLGRLDGPLYHYDINSAYPYALTKLRCHACGHFEKVDKLDIDEPGNLAFVTWRASPPWVDPTVRAPWGPFPVRVGSGSLRYPLVNETGGWYWSEEIRAALPLTNLKVHRGYRFIPGCEHDPFHFIPAMYELRQELKRQGDPAEYTYKIILASCYGKLAQRPRGKRMPPFHAPAWAGRVTAICRSQILDAIAQAPNAIVQIATDGLSSLERLDLPISKALGDWSVRDLEFLFMVQSGIYFWQDLDGEIVQKSRGFSPKAMTYEAVREHWDQAPRKPLKFDNTRFIGYRTALHWGKLDLWRSWYDYEVKLSMTPEPRRETVGYTDGHLISVPPIRARGMAFDEIWAKDLRSEQEWAEDQPDGPEGDFL